MTARDTFAGIKDRLRLPAVCAPMFLVSGPDLVTAACHAGVIGAFPTINARTTDDLESWCSGLASAVPRGDGAPWAANLIVHNTNERFRDDLEIVCQYQPELVITALGSPARAVPAVHAYGGLVFADVSTVSYARKAADAGADGLILVCAGAGGHTGQISPFAFVPEVRQFFDGPIVVAGAIADGNGIRAVLELGADLAYLGTPFIAASESLANDTYRKHLIAADAEALTQTAFFTGVTANYLTASITDAGIPLAALDQPKENLKFGPQDAEIKAWRDIFSAGQGVGAIASTQSAAQIVDRYVATFQR